MAPPPKIQIAPMMGYTDRHYRYFIRLISQHVELFTEMVSAQNILHGNQDKLLAYHETEHPLCLQLGGSNPLELAKATKIAAAYGYDAINLNLGCPSARVQSGMIGACLMLQSKRVADCIDAMQNACTLPVSIKMRTGIDHLDSYDFLQEFIYTIAQTGCKTFIIHARKAWLKGLSPKENREIPPLEYEKVYQIKRDFKHLTIILNGGVQSLPEAKEHLKQVDGIMMGRVIYQNPYLLAPIDQTFYQAQQPLDRGAILLRLLPYLEQERSKGTLPHHITRHILGLFQGIPGAKYWRQLLTGPEKDTLDFAQVFRNYCALMLKKSPTAPL